MVWQPYEGKWCLKPWAFAGCLIFRLASSWMAEKAENPVLIEILQETPETLTCCFHLFPMTVSACSTVQPSIFSNSGDMAIKGTQIWGDHKPVTT